MDYGNPRQLKMGDRITRYYPCPKGCGGEVEEYDASSSLMFVAICDKCWWKDPRNYYEISDSEIMLGTPEQAREQGGLVICKKCGKEVMGSYIEENGCLVCDDPNFDN